ncbi:thioredoxin domain-containing protein [Taibaiella soli]|nr:thioredoxin domain-containing protein [Taibaiella soli]
MSNRLKNEQSPYLLQHAHNPVDWYPWGDEAFERAKAENKPVIVSIGYAACHWCHVMERESFEDKTVAAYMNEHFICIKVDREEHPDVDHLYMDAVQAISGSGGWPLNAFVTPERIPFYGGTYFPPGPAYNRPSWSQVLQRMNEIWHQQPGEIKTQTTQMVQFLKQTAQTSMSSDKTADWNMDSCRKMVENLLQMADTEQGGFGRAPKFPGTMAISFLLEHYHFTKHEPSLKQALLSLDKMLEGGIYDQLGGGFARYATDNEWLIPHFEKMLYDNALLIVSLADAYALTKENRYKKIIEETVAFADRELWNGVGGYFSALDADSEGVEGKYYTWTWTEWVDALGGNDEVVAAYFGVSEEGNWEETNILSVVSTDETLAARFLLPLEEIQNRIASAKTKLFEFRKSKIRPATDDKTLLSWNALMNLALTKAGQVLENDVYKQKATAHMQWLLQTFVTPSGDLLHTWKDGIARISANLDDYAYLIQALLQLASVTGELRWIPEAKNWCDYVLTHFQHESGNFFYFTSDLQKDIPIRKLDLYDGATPSGNAVMAHNLLWLGLCTENHSWLEQSHFMMRQTVSTAMRYPYSFGNWCILAQRYTKDPKTVVCIGVKAGIHAAVLREYFTPNCYLIETVEENFEIPVLRDKYFQGENYIFVCTRQACLAPYKEPEAVLPLIRG